MVDVKPHASRLKIDYIIGCIAEKSMHNLWGNYKALANYTSGVTKKYYGNTL